MNRQWQLTAYADGLPGPAHFTLVETAVPEPADGELVVQAHYFGLDPSPRLRMSAQGKVPPLPLGSVMLGRGVGQVIASRHPKFAAGDFVAGEFGWQEFALLDGQGLTPVNPALIEAAEKDPESAIAMMLSWGFGPAGHLHQGPIPGNSMLAGGRKVMRRNVPNELAADLKACNPYKNGKAAAAAIRCPVQVVLAGKDRMAPRKAGMELVAHLNEPELHVVEESGHIIPQEAPNRLRRLLRDFIFRHNPAR